MGNRFVLALFILSFETREKDSIPSEFIFIFILHSISGWLMSGRKIDLKSPFVFVIQKFPIFIISNEIWYQNFKIMDANESDSFTATGISMWVTFKCVIRFAFKVMPTAFMIKILFALIKIKRRESLLNP